VNLIFSQEFNSEEDSAFGYVLSPSAFDTPAENDWCAAIEARLASLESDIAELKASQPRDSSMRIHAPCPHVAMLHRRKIFDKVWQSL
jgi:hypothetical protein